MRYQMPSWTELKQHRISAAILIITIGALLVTHLYWLTPIMAQKAELEAQVNQRNELIHKYQEKLDKAHSIRQELEKQESELKELQKHLFKGNDPYQLAASLGELLSAKDGPKLDIKTYQVLASKEYGLYQEVHIRFNFMSNVDGLHYFLERIKNFQAVILVHEMNIQKIQRKTGPDLVINVILAALMEKGEKGSSERQT